jgi:signal transduction histidine kinase
MNPNLISDHYFQVLALVSLGSSLMAALYHGILYLQHKESILIDFCVYLLVVSLFTIYRLFFGGIAGDTMLYGDTSVYTLVDEPLQMLLYVSYINFIAKSNNLNAPDTPVLSRVIKYLQIFLITYSVLHVAGILSQLFTQRIPLVNIGSRTLLILAAMALLLASWKQRKEPYYRYLLAGGIVFTLCGLLAFTSSFFGFSILGLSGLSITFVGVFLDVLFFSAAVGYKLKEAYQKVLQVRLKISQDLHDQVGATLTSISFLSEVARNQMEKDGPATSYVTQIGEYSREMITEMNDIVWAINPSNDRFDKLADRMQNFALPLLTARNIEFQFLQDGRLQDLLLTMQQRKSLYLIFKEAVNNAAKYSGCRHLAVKLQKESTQVLLEIFDDGKGFDAGAHSEGNGLKNMKYRAAEASSSLKVRSGINQGTRVSLQMPITQNAH